MSEHSIETSVAFDSLPVPSLQDGDMVRVDGQEGTTPQVWGPGETVSFVLMVDADGRVSVRHP